MKRSLFCLNHTYHLAIACQHLMSSSSHSLLVPWVYLKMGVLQNFMVNHHIPYPMDFTILMAERDATLRSAAGATLHLADEV